jgi:hypothetical protein
MCPVFWLWTFFTKRERKFTVSILLQEKSYAECIDVRSSHTWDVHKVSGLILFKSNDRDRPSMHFIHSSLYNYYNLCWSKRIYENIETYFRPLYRHWQKLKTWAKLYVLKDQLSFKIYEYRVAVYSNDALSYTEIFEWTRRFKRE